MPVDLDALEKVLAAMTPGPWKMCSASDGGCACGLLWSLHADRIVGTVKPDLGDDSYINRSEDGHGIVALRNAAPTLINELREAQYKNLGLGMEVEHFQEGLNEAKATIRELKASLNGEDRPLAEKLCDLRADLAAINLVLEGAAEDLEKVDPDHAAYVRSFITPKEGGGDVG